MDPKKLTDQNVSEIDKALNAAKARKAQKGSNAVPATPKAPSEPKRARLTDEEKASRQATKDADRASRKATRAAVRAAKLAERTAGKSPAHLRKVMKAGERLPMLTEQAQLIFNEATASLPAVSLAALALHIMHFNRANSTKRALDQKLVIGQAVRIVGGESRFIGQTGTVAKSQRIRAYIDVPGVKKPVYVFTADCEVINDQAQATA